MLKTMLCWHNVPVPTSQNVWPKCNQNVSYDTIPDSGGYQFEKALCSNCMVLTHSTVAIATTAVVMHVSRGLCAYQIQERPYVKLFSMQAIPETGLFLLTAIP